MSAKRPGGGFTADDVKPGSRYELSEGHPVYRAPTGGKGARSNAAGAEVLDTDPDVEAAGVDAGFSPNARTLRAPDIAVGNVQDVPGWIPGAPALAAEYAGPGEDEQELQLEISELLHAGTRFIWAPARC